MWIPGPDPDPDPRQNEMDPKRCFPVQKFARVGSTTTSFHMTYMTKVIGNDIDVVGRPKMVEIDYKIKNM